MQRGKTFWKRLLKKILDLPYILLFDRITPFYLRHAFYTKSYIGINEFYPTATFCQNARWKDYFSNSCGKKVVLLGIGDAFWKVSDQEKGMIECGIDWSGNHCGKMRNGVQIFPPSYLTTLAKRDKYVYLISKTNYIGVQTAIALLEGCGIHEYYSYANMECKRPKYILSRLAYRFLRFRNFLIHEEGFIPSCVTFYLKMMLRPVWPKLARSSYNRIKALKDRHKGQRCFIVATGPSLTVADVEMLKDEVTFGVNSIYRLFSQTDWRPTYYTMIDYHALLNARKDGDSIDFNSCCQKEYFITDKIYHMAGLSEQDGRAAALLINYLDHMVFGEGFHHKYRKNIASGLYNASTVVNSCINIAHYMGFSEIYLIGVDCNYSLPTQYFDGTKSHQAIDLEHATMMHCFMKSGYSFYKKKMDEFGVKVFNATRGGNLEIFPRVCLENVMSQCSGRNKK